MANQYRVKTGVKLYTQVLEQVKSMIAQGVYKKGDLLPSEKELIEMMGVSRITVRKALQILSEAGVIETRKGKGSFVAVDASELAPASMDLKKYCESFVQATRARLLLEPAIARQAAQTATPEELEQLRKNVHTALPMDRFHGKKVIICKVADGINKAEQLLTRAAEGKAAVYEAGGDAAESKETEGKESVGHQIYKHLMNGVSHMLPFVVGGGILIALAFLIDGLLVDLNHVPQYLIDKYGSVADVKSNFGTLTPVAYFLKAQVGGVAFSFMLPILAGFIAMSIADRPGLALGFLGGAIAANGKSGFLGALAAGFIAGYVVLLLKKIFSKLPSALEGMVPILLIPVFGLLITGAGMVYVIEPVVGFINTALNNGLKNMSGANIILLGALLGAMMAVDMGGPVNKAAYVFGTAQIAAGNYDIMAAVMIGGMVPPIAIAIASLLFKNKFTEQERKAGPTNFVMGLSFITEGAIPFAAADPLHVIPACVVGAGVAGGLSAAFNCTLMAPHGGIFVFPVVGHAAMYLVALVVGSIISALLLGVLKKKVVA